MTQLDPLNTIGLLTAMSSIQTNCRCDERGVGGKYTNPGQVFREYLQKGCGRGLAPLPIVRYFRGGGTLPVWSKSNKPRSGNICNNP